MVDAALAIPAESFDSTAVCNAVLADLMLVRTLCSVLSSVVKMVVAEACCELVSDNSVVSLATRFATI